MIIRDFFETLRAQSQIEAKLAITALAPPHDKLVVTAGGEVLRLDRETTAVPVGELGSYLLAQQSR